MARLTGFSKILITALILLGLFFAGKKFIPGFGSKTGIETVGSSSNNQTQNSNGQVQPPNPPTDNSGNPIQSSADGAMGFTYIPVVPVNGKLKGVVELGATGFNSFIINVDAEKRWKLEKADYGSSLVYENMATDQDIRAGLKNYIANMLGYGVNGKEIHFVISSGAQKVPATEKIISALKSLGYVVNSVTPEQEGKYALKAVLPSIFYNNSFVVDIGSGNTKISWMQNGQSVGIETYGSKYFQNGISDATVADDIKVKAAQIPGGQRYTCFIVGGVPFELAKQTRKEKERHTVLKSPSSYKIEGEKQKAGINIYKSIAENTGCKEFVFDWDANFTIGFLLSL